METPSRPRAATRLGGDDRQATGGVGGPGGEFRGAQLAVGLRDRGRKAKRAVAGGHGDDRAPFGGECDRVLPVRGCGR